MSRLVSGIVLLALVASCGKPAMSAVAPADPEVPRGAPVEPAHALELPGDVTLQRVALRLRVDPAADHFAGVVALHLHFPRKTAEFLLHAEDLEVQSAHVEQGEKIVSAKIEPTSVRGVARVRLANEVKGEAVLEIEYRGEFSDSLEGLYVVRDGAGRYALTQMQPIAARRVFPGFDQMRTKVPYALTLEVPERMIAVANAAEASRYAIGDGFDEVRFEPTPPLPSYLVAFAVGPFDVVQGPALPPTAHRAHEIRLRGLATRGRGIEIRTALENVRPLVEALEAYFESAAPIEKLDLLAAPDFAAGAMENPGLFVVRDSILLLSPKVDAAARRLFVQVMAHELAHLWFGHVATPARFEDIWLNEAFATYLAYEVVARAHPQHRAEVLRAKSANRAKDVDALPGARPILRRMSSVHDVKGAFDVLTYEKGAALLHAVEEFVGEDAMRRAIVAHVRAAADSGVTDTEAFLRALEEATSSAIAASLRDALQRGGVPEVRFEVDCAAAPSIRLRQREGETRSILICMRVDGGPTCLHLDEPERVVSLSRCPSRLEPNVDGAGYYRSVLEGELFEWYLKRSFSLVSAAENVVFFGDATARFHEGALSFGRYLELLRLLGRSRLETLETLPLEPLRFLHDEVAKADSRRRVRALLAELYVERFRALGFEAGPDEAADRARDAIGAVILERIDDPALRDEAVSRAKSFLGYGTRPDADALAPGLRAPALSLALAVEGARFFDALVERFRTTVSVTERGDLLRAIGSARDGKLRERALELVFDPAVRKNEVLVLLGAQLARRETRADAFAFLVSRWEPLVAKLGPSTAGSLASLAAYACDPAEAASVEARLAPLADDVPGGPSFLATGLARARDCAARVERERAALSGSPSP
ncbi:MAG: hypothetical protein GXY23_05010 [Myxococcales bacterium]|nr:hypothetical protein [Myxococcales bacterium]